MRPDVQTPQSADDPQAWFAGVQGVTAPPTSPEPAQRSSKRKFFFIGVAALVLIIAGLSAVKFFSVEPCLTADDYRSFTGGVADTQLSPQAFYTASFGFTAASDEFAEASAGVSDQMLRKIAAFDVKKRSSSLIITLSADYFPNDSADAAIGRLSVLKQKLVSYGAAESDIVVEDPAEIGASGEMPEEYEIPEEPIAYASIASAPVCR